MYVPKHFELDATRTRQLMAERSAGDLITLGPEGLDATFLPFSYDPDDGELGTLKCHVGRVNRQWQHTGQALVIMHGPDAYIGPSMVPSASDPHANLLGRLTIVPTWNYLTVHLRGQLIAHTEPQWIRQSLVELVATHDPSWDIDVVPKDKMAGMLKAIVGLEIRLTSVVGKAKMSQNRSADDICGIAGALAEGGHSPETVQFLREVSLPHAQAREAELDRLRSTRA